MTQRQDPSQRGRSIMRWISEAVAPLVARVNSLIELERLTSYSGGADQVGQATAEGGESVTVVETYGFAARPSGSAQAVVLAVGADTSNRYVIGSIAPSGRPATESGDVVVWSQVGHSLALDQDGGLIITSAGGRPVTINAGAGASVTINVDAGQSVLIGDGAALALAKAAALEANIDSMLAGGVPVANDGGASLKTTMTAAWNLAKGLNPIATTRAKGT